MRPTRPNRNGIAYSPDAKTAIRAGYGIFYGGLESTGYYPNLGENYPFQYEANFPAGTCSAYACTTDGITIGGGFSSIVAKGFAIMESGKIQLSGLIAWFAWATVHLAFLAQFSLKLSIFVQWAWAFISGGQGGARIIVKHHALESTVPESMASVPHSQIRSSTDFALVALSDPRQK